MKGCCLVRPQRSSLLSSQTRGGCCRIIYIRRFHPAQLFCAVVACYVVIPNCQNNIRLHFRIFYYSLLFHRQNIFFCYVQPWNSCPQSISGQNSTVTCTLNESLTSFFVIFGLVRDRTNDRHSEHQSVFKFFFFPKERTRI